MNLKMKLLVLVTLLVCQVHSQSDKDNEEETVLELSHEVGGAIKEFKNFSNVFQEASVELEKSIESDNETDVGGEIEELSAELEEEAADMQHTADEIRKSVKVVLKQAPENMEPITKKDRRKIIDDTRKKIYRFEGRIKQFRTRLRFIRHNRLRDWITEMGRLSKVKRLKRLANIKERIGIFRSKIVNFRERGFSFRREIRGMRSDLRALRRRPVIVIKSN